MRIYEAEIDVPCRVIGLQGEPAIVERLEEMGLSKGRDLQFVRRLPLRGPFIVQAGSTFIALREEEAACIEVERAVAP